MAVATTNAFSGPFTANGVTTIFPFTFTVLSGVDVTVALRDADGVETTVSANDYSVSLTGDGPSAGSVTFDVAPATGNTVWLYLDPDFTQETEFVDGHPFLAGAVNNANDRAALRDQVLRRDVDRALLVPIGEEGIALPAAAERANKYLMFDADGAAQMDDPDNFAAPANAAAADAALSAAAAQAGVNNFFTTIAAGVSGTAVDGFFASAESGSTRIYQRTSTSPFYVDQGDAAAPATKALLAASSGAGRVGKLGGGNMQDVATRQQIIVGTTHINVQAEYGVTTSDAQTPTQRAAAIQEAFDTAPLGSTLHFPPGMLVVVGELTMSRQMNLQGHGTILVSVPGGADKSALKIRLAEAVGQPAPPALNDSRGMRITDMIIHAQGSCNNCVDIRHEVGDHPYNIATLQMFIQNNTFSVPNDAAGHALRFSGLVTQMHVVQSNQIINGIYLYGPADCSRILYNNFFGQKTAVSGWLAEGAFATLIMGNTMVCRDGALYLTGGSQVYFWQNQIENSEGNGQGSQAFDASVVVYAAQYRCRQISIKHNNFGGGEFICHNIAIAGEPSVGGGDFDIRDVIIEENVFNRGAYTWEGAPNAPLDIILSNSLVKNTIIGKNFYRGEGTARGGSAFSTYPGMTPNTLDQDELIQIFDASEGAIGLRQPAARLTKANGYAGGTTFIKTADNIVWPSAAPLTSATPGANNAGTLVATYPVGYRPPENVYRTAICVQSGVGTFPVLVLINTAGEVILAENAPAADIRLPEFRCVGSATYSSGP